MRPQKKGDYIPGLRVIWPDAKPSDEVLKTVEDLRQEGNFTEEELERLKLYLMSVEYNPGYMEDAVLLHENNPQYSVEEYYQAILDN